MQTLRTIEYSLDDSSVGPGPRSPALRVPLARLLQLLMILQSERFPNARRLSEACEVSRRTIYRDLAENYDMQAWMTVLQVNLNSVFRLCQLAGRTMLEQRQGKIINIASLLSFQGGIRVPAYAASKGGISQLTKALANEWAGRNVQVNAIAPGYFRTDNTSALQKDEVRNRQILERIPAGRWGEPEDIAHLVTFVVSPEGRFLHGSLIDIDGGQTKTI